MPEIAQRNAFGELLALLSEEELIRFKRRAEIAHNYWLAELFDDEFTERSLPTHYA